MACPRKTIFSWRKQSSTC